MPDATQWDQIEKVGNCDYVVFEHLEKVAAQGELIYQDDTSVRILSLLGENLKMRAQAEAMGLSRPTERTGMYTTALVVQVGEHTICLYYSGRCHAGENLKALLLQRQADRDKPLVMSDALSHNEADETDADSLSLSGSRPPPVQRSRRRLSPRVCRGHQGAQAGV